MEKKMPLQNYFDSPMSLMPPDGENNSKINLQFYDQKLLIPRICSYVEEDITFLD